MPGILPITGIDRSIRNACTITFDTYGNINKDPPLATGYGDYVITFYKLLKKTPKLTNPINGKFSSVFGGTFERANPYVESEFVTREQFNDSMFMCQCHEGSFGENDVYQEYTFTDFNEFCQFMRIIVNEKYVNALSCELSHLTDWHIIENCGNFKCLTAEDETHYYSFQMMTT